MIFSRTDPFADWLDVTFSPDLSELRDHIMLWLDQNCFPISQAEDRGRSFWDVGQGKLMFHRCDKFQRVSASGGVLSSLREAGLFRDYCNLLGEFPHKITRLDVAVDTSQDFPGVLSALEARYPDGSFYFGRKSLKITKMLSRRELDNCETGTWYAGHRSAARVTGRVYDKQAEALDKRHEELPPTTRYELTFRKDYGVSFWDVLMPRDIFYHHADSTLLECDGPFAPWESRGLVPWVSEPRSSRLTLEQFERRLEASPDLDHLIELVSDLGPAAKAILMRRFESRLDAVLANSRSSSSGSDTAA